VTSKAGEFGGPIAKNHGEEGMAALYDAIGLGPDDGCFFAAGKEEQAAKLAGASLKSEDSVDAQPSSRLVTCGAGAWLAPAFMNQLH